MHNDDQVRAMKENEWGARIERGEITSSGGGRYKVKSLDREGVSTPWIKVLDMTPKVELQVTHDRYDSTVTEKIEATYTPSEYTVGDMVYFFMFSDGHGAILGKAE